MSNHRHGPMIASSICIKCGNTFIIASDQQHIVPGMSLNLIDHDQFIDRPLKTWADWLNHIASRCSVCRYSSPPQQCLDNLREIITKKYKERTMDRNSELEEDIVKLAPYGKPKMSNKPRIAAVLLGPPCSGKGTLGKALYMYCGVPVVTPGNIYKALREEESAMGEQVREALKDGGYCPDSMTNAVVQGEAEKLIIQGAPAVIMDGYPRTPEQLQYIRTNYEIAFYICLSQPYDILLARAMSRYECPICHEVCSTSDTFLQCDCETNQSEHILRWDDTAEMFPKRYETYLKLTQPVVDYLEQIPYSDKHRFRYIKTSLNRHSTKMLCNEVRNELKNIGWT